jgi:hypothetical protein
LHRRKNARFLRQFWRRLGRHQARHMERRQAAAIPFFVGRRR